MILWGAPQVDQERPAGLAPDFWSLPTSGLPPLFEFARLYLLSVCFSFTPLSHSLAPKHSHPVDIHFNVFLEKFFILKNRK